MISLGTISSQATSAVPSDRYVNINFSHVDRSDDNIAGWNTIRYPNAESFSPEGISFTDLLDSDGVNTGFTFACVDSGVIGTSDVNGSETQPALGVYQVDIWSTPFIVSTFAISGLDDGKTYDLRFIPNINEAANRSTVGGVSQRNPAAYPTSADFDDPNQMTFNNITPVSGSIQFIIDGVSGEGDYWSFFAMRIREKQ